jgi:hypothetical protein
MFAAACHSFLEPEGQTELLNRIEEAPESLGCKLVTNDIRIAGAAGKAIEWQSESRSETISGDLAIESLERVSEGFGLSAGGRRFVSGVIGDIISAESKAHGVHPHDVHLHEIGRAAGLMNIALAGLCHDLLDLGGREVIGSYLVIGKGEVRTAHGILRIPTPAAAELLAGLRFRFGPHVGEMATPSGIAIIRNALTGQQDVLPKASASRLGFGFGNRSFDGERGYAIVYESDHEER